MASLGSLKSAIFEKEERKMQYQSHIRGLNAYDRHKKFMRDYEFNTKLLSSPKSQLHNKKASYQVEFYGKGKNMRDVLPIKTDKDTIREGYRFILSEEDDMDSTWENRLVKRYYDKLFKEYCIADMSQYKKGKIGLRWRTEKEVISGKGQFVCGNKECNEKGDLGSYEVNFAYFEAGENKQALVKLVACKRCAEKLVYKKQKEKERQNEKEKQKEEEQPERKEKDRHKRKRERGRHDDVSTDDEYDSSDTKRKGRKHSSSGVARPEDDENFEEFMEGMFP